MAWFPIVLAAVFISTAAPSAGKGLPPPHPADFNKGVGEVHSIYDGFLCTAAFLKPWILLTSGDCVHKQPRFNLFVNVRNPDYTDGTISTTVRVFDVTFHPEYKNGDTEYNLALLHVFPAPHRNFGEFVVKDRNFTDDELIDQDLQTYVAHYEKYPRKMKAKVTKDHTICNAVDTVENMYCVETDKSLTYYRRDFGTPFFFESENERVLVGNFMGLKLNESAPGHLFASTFLGSKWILEYMESNPEPPARFSADKK